MPETLEDRLPTNLFWGVLDPVTPLLLDHVPKTVGLALPGEQGSAVAPGWKGIAFATSSNVASTTPALPPRPSLPLPISDVVDSGTSQLRAFSESLPGSGDGSGQLLDDPPDNQAPIAREDPFTTYHDRGFCIPAPGVLGNDFDPDGGPGALTAHLVTGPSHGILSNFSPDGSFDYYPDEDYVGQDSFTYQAFDGELYSNVTTAFIGVVNSAPIGIHDVFEIHHDTVLPFDYFESFVSVLANDLDNEQDPLSARLVSGPMHGDLEFDVGADGNFVYTPDPSYVGYDSFMYIVNDGVRDATSPTPVFIRIMNDLPTANGDGFSVVHDQELRIGGGGVLFNDTDNDDDDLTAALLPGIEPVHGNLVLNADGSFVYTPEAGFVGQDSFAYVASDGLTTTPPVPVMIEVTNTVPTGQADSLGVNAGSPIAGIESVLLRNDEDPDGDAFTLSSIAEEPLHGTMTQASGVWTYTPNTGYVGVDSFSYVLSDGVSESDAVAVALNIHSINNSPSPIDDDYGVDKDGTLEVDAAHGLVINDLDSEDDVLTVELLTGPSDGTLSLAANGSFTYTPDTGFTGEDSFTYVVADGTGAQPGFVTGTVRVAVASIASVTFAAATNGGDFDNLNPAQFGGGYRFFPDAEDYDNRLDLDRNRILVRAAVTGAAQGTPVWFRSFDVDDPSIDKIIDRNDIFSGGPVPGPRGRDNRGKLDGNQHVSLPDELTPQYVSGYRGILRPLLPVGSGLGEEGKPVKTLVDAQGMATVELYTSFAPGDNLRVLASMEEGALSPRALNDLNSVPTTGAVPNFKGAASPQLSVWRHLFVEQDKMAATTSADIVAGTICASPRANADGTFTSTVFTGASLVVPDEFEEGILRGADGGNHDIVKADPNVPGKANSGGLLFGGVPIFVTTKTKPGTGPVTLYQDDMKWIGNDPPTPRANTQDDSNLYDLMKKSPDRDLNRYADAYIEPEYAALDRFDSNDLTSYPHFNGESAANWEAIDPFRGTRNADSENPVFWVVYVSTAYEPESSEDNDPAGELATTGTTRRTHEPSLVYVEVGRDMIASGEVLLGENVARARTTVHEVGHQFDLARIGPEVERSHRRGESIMRAFTLRLPDNRFYFHSYDVVHMRQRYSSPGRGD
jgi:hypothetical protein